MVLPEGTARRGVEVVERFELVRRAKTLSLQLREDGTTGEWTGNGYLIKIGVFSEGKSLENPPKELNQDLPSAWVASLLNLKAIGRESAPRPHSSS
jgi:hypothetical protein